ncbi:MAG TPA: hypothetical protein VL422_13005 [Miltoncostaea sp.]|nr:hypothetical protein [Miltoncostaea sp.]
MAGAGKVHDTMSTKLRLRAPLAALATLTLLGSPIVADDVSHGLLHVGGHAAAAEATAADTTVQAQAATLIRDASRRSGITAEGAYNAYELSETGPLGSPWIRNRLVDGQTGATAAMPSERNDGQLGGVPLDSERWVVWYERFTEMPNTTLDRWQVVGPEIHGPNVSAFPQALLMLEVSPDKHRRLNANAGRSTVRYRDIGTIELGRTYAMKMHVRLSAGSDGIIEIWRDGAKVVTLTGPTIDQAIAGSYWKEANYRNADIDGPMTHDFSSLKIYDGDPGGYGTGADPAPPPSTDPAPAPPPSTTPPPTTDPAPSTGTTVPSLTQPLPTGTLQPNPTFTNGLTGWSSWQGTASVVTAADGSKVANVARATGTTFTLGETTPSVAAPVVGAKYRAVAYVRAANGQSVGKQARVFARQMGKQDVPGNTVTLSTSWQPTSADITANSTTGIDTRVGFENAVSGDAMQVAMVATSAASGSSTTPAPAPAPSAGVIAQEGFEGAVPGSTGSLWKVINTSGNRFSVVASPVRNGAKAGSFEQAGTGNQVSLRTNFAGRRDVTATASVYISRNTLGLNRNHSIMRITSGPGSTPGPRHEVGIFRDGSGAMHWAIWSVGKNGNYTNARIGSAPKVGVWQTLKLESQWDRSAAATRLTVDGKEILQPTSVDMSGVTANSVEVGLNYSNPADKALIAVDDVAVTDAALGAIGVAGGHGRTSSRPVSPFGAEMVALTAPKVVHANKQAALTFQSPGKVRYTVTILKGRTSVARFHRTSVAGLNRVGFRVPAIAGAYTARVQFAQGSATAAFRVQGRQG